MAARLAIKATESNAHDKGAIVSGGPANFDFGSKVVLPLYITVTITDATWKQIRDYIAPITVAPKFTVQLSNPATGDYRIVLEGEEAGPLSGISRDAVQAYLDAWGAVYVSHDDRSVTFDWNLFSAVASIGFWDGVNVAAVTFLNDGYTDGVLRCTADYSATTFAPNDVAQQCMNRGLDVIDHDAGVITLDVEPQDIRAAFLREVTNRFSAMRRKARYKIAESAVDFVVGQGGTGSFSRAQLASNLVDLNG